MGSRIIIYPVGRHCGVEYPYSYWIYAEDECILWADLDPDTRKISFREIPGVNVPPWASPNTVTKALMEYFRYSPPRRWWW